MKAFKEDNLSIGEKQIHKFRGLEKVFLVSYCRSSQSHPDRQRDAIRSLLRELAKDFDERRVDRIFESFSKKLHANISRVKEIDGASAIFRTLREKKIAVAVGRYVSVWFLRDLFE